MVGGLAVGLGGELEAVEVEDVGGDVEEGAAREDEDGEGENRVGTHGI